MNRIVLGGLAALLLVAAGIFWWQGRAASERGAALPVAPISTPDETLPQADPAGLRGPPPPEVDPVTREQRRFDRLDRNRDGRINRNEMLAPRVPAFRKLDVDGNNLLTFEEWAILTSERFRQADANRDASLSRVEFATTRPKRTAKPECRCPPPRKPARAMAAEPEADEDSDGDGDEPVG